MPRAKKTAPKSTDAHEEKVFKDTLKANKKVVPAGAPLPAGATHTEDKSGKLKRKRFSAV